MLVSGLIRVVKIMEVVVFSFECKFVECLVLADREKRSFFKIPQNFFPTHALNTVAPSFPLLPLFIYLFLFFFVQFNLLFDWNVLR